jgi:tetratricopeptide (TPR) repeat protein
VLDLEPGHHDAARQLAEAQARLEQQEEEERAQRQAQARLAELDRLFSTGNAAAHVEDWRKAIQYFEQVVKLDEGYQDAAARLVGARVALVREEADRRRRAALGERYDKARERMEARDWPEAERLLREVWDAAACLISSPLWIHTTTGPTWLPMYERCCAF